MKLSEFFYSVQGEGISQGIPAYFIRFSDCNFNCKWCDTSSVLKKSFDLTYNELEEKIKESGQFNNILGGSTHLVWTGGEPLLYVNEIKNFLIHMKKSYPSNSIYNEIETNASLKVDNNFWRYYTQQINCSPKLANSGVGKEKRIIPDSLMQIENHINSYFKFVISSEEDILEMERDFIFPFNLSKSKIILMPLSSDLSTLSQSTAFCYEMTKKYGYRTISRGHILAWDKKAGV